MSYKQNLVFEPVEVITYHTLVEMIILKFKWKNKVYKVSKLNSRWTVPGKDFWFTHFTVICSQDNIIAELLYNHKDFKWELIQWDKLS